MATTPTNLPVPSESPRDLKFNAGKIDEFVTSVVNTYVDRFGNPHYTIEGLRWLAQQAIAAFGWIPVESFQDGATLTLPNEILKDTDSGEYYRWDGAFPKVVPAGSTPSSTGGVGVGAWIGVGDSALRNMLGLIDGETLIGGATYAQIRTSNLAGNQIKCLGRAANRDGGEGWFFLDSSDTTTADDDGTVLIDAVGRRWKRSYDGAKMASWFGVKSGAEVSAAIQNMLNTGNGGIIFKDGQYNSNTKIAVDLYNGGASYPPPGRPSSRFDFIGSSMANTTFNTSGNDFLEATYGGTIPTQAVAAFFRYKNFSIYGPTVAAGVGLRITGAAYSQLDSVHAVKMSTGASLIGVLTSEIRNSLFRVCAKNGLYFDTGGNSTVNAMTINNTVFVDNGELGVLGNIGARFTLRDCNFETCGTTNGATAQGAVRLTVKEPMATVNIEGAWFEGNAGEADLYIDNATVGLITVNISSSVFIRGVGGRWCTNNIKTTTSGGGLIKIVFGDGNQFYSMSGDYTPDVSRPYFNFNGRTIPVGIDKCNFNETTSKSLTSVGYSDVVISGAVSSAGALLAAPPRCTSSKVTTGVYSLIFSEGLSINIDSILCTATSRTDAILVMRAVPVSVNEVRVYTVNATGTPTDGAFNFMITSSR